MPIDFQRLSRPFSPDKIKWRPGATTKDGKRALALAYIDARDVADRLDEVVGPTNWQTSYYSLTNGTTMCKLELWDGEKKQWIHKEDGSPETNIEAEKGAISRALCRTASMWGIGRYIYGLKQEWVDLNDFKQIVNPPKLPDWAIPKATDQQIALINNLLNHENIDDLKRKQAESTLKAGMTEEAADRFILRLRAITEGQAA